MPRRGRRASGDGGLPVRGELCHERPRRDDARLETRSVFAVERAPAEAHFLIGDERVLHGRGKVSGALQLVGELLEGAARLVTVADPGQQAQQAFDIAQESPQLRDRYGRNITGQRMLLARRLVEAGVPLRVITSAALPVKAA